jgi:hypothetical protein
MGAGPLWQLQTTIVQGACGVTSLSTLPVAGVCYGVTPDLQISHRVP